MVFFQSSLFCCRIFLFLLLLATSSPALAQKTLSIDIFGPGQHQLNLVMAKPLHLTPGLPAPPEALILEEYLRSFLEFMPFLRLVPGSEVLGGDVLTGVTAQHVDFGRFRLNRVDLVLTAGWGGNAGLGPVELRVYETFEQRLVLGKAYSGITPEELPEVAARFCAELMEALTGQGDFFRSTLAVVKTHGQNKELWEASPFGLGLRQLTDLGGISMSPAWSKDGRTLAFTLIADGRHYLALLDKDNKDVRRVRLPGNSVISPTFHPQGWLAVSLDQEMDIYQLGNDYRIDRKLVQNWAIDISPSFDASGEKMVFVSSRLGNPHIFLLDLRTGDVRRVTYEGNYNTNPSLSPDGRLVIFSRRTNEGHRIFLSDLTTGMERQLTFGPGNDVSPAWAPDGYFIAFSSSRTGEYKIYLTTRHGDRPRMVPLGPGEFTSPAWARR
jgi:TolB protein